MKKHLALVLALVMVLGSFSFVSAAPDFSDVKDTPFEDAVTRLESLNVLKGYPDGTFKPANTITRAEFAAVAVRVSGLESAAMAAKGLPTGFSDVPAYHWASGYVGTAAKLGIVNGIGGGMFAPETPVKYEEAITMVVRALGFEPAAQAKGGYPFGYLIVANDIDLLEDAMGTQGTWATRGFVAQITDNALEIPMMIQVGYGSETKFVVSGESDTDEVYLLEKMGFESVEGRVVDFDLDDMEIDIENEDIYEVKEGFDFYKVYGVTIKAWLDGDEVIAYVLKDNVMFDAVEFEEDDRAMALVTADKDYDLKEDRDDKVVTMLALDNATVKWDEDDFMADYAKVVMDGNKVVWANGVVFDDMIVMEEIDDDVIVDLNDDEADVEDYLIVKDGMTISIEDLEKGDVVFLYNDNYADYDGFAVVGTLTKEGVVTKAYTNSFRLDGTTYDLAADAMYLDDDTLATVDEDALSAFEDEGEKITIVLDWKGDVVLMNGTRGEAATSTYGAILTKDAVTFQGRRNLMIAWDMVNEMGEKVSFDEEATDDEEIDYPAGDKVKDEWTVVEYTIEDDGDLDDVDYELESYTGTAVKDTLEVGDRYTPTTVSKRLMNSTIVFLVDKDDEEVDEVFKWEDAKDYFGEATDYDVYYEGGEVTYLVVKDSDAAGDFDWTAGVLTKVRKLAGSTKYELTLNIEGTKEDIVFDNSDAKVIPNLSTLTSADYGKIYEAKVNEDMTEGKELRLAPSTDINLNTATTGAAINVSAKTFTDGTDTWELTRDGVVFDRDGTAVNFRDFANYLDAEDDITIDVYFDGRIKDSAGVYSDTFVKYIVIRGYNK